MPEIKFFIDDGGGAAGDGDAIVHSDGTPTGSWLPNATTGPVGRLAKAAPEQNGFFRFDCSSVPLGSVINGANFSFHSTPGSSGTGAISVGFIHHDGTWEDDGFGTSGNYILPYKFPNDGTAIPHATQDGSAALEFFKVVIGFFGAYDLSVIQLFPSGARFGMGSGTAVEEPPINISAPLAITYFNSARNVFNYSVIGVTMDSDAVGNADNFVSMYTSDHATSDFHPELIVNYTLNPPDFTSVPVETADMGCPYAYTAQADPYSLGDQTSGFHLGVTYSLAGTVPLNPGGAPATIDPSSGEITWTPPTWTVVPGAFTFTVRATNEGGEFTDQVFEVVVSRPAFPDITSTPPTTATVGSVYVYQATADNPVEACQDPTLTWSLTVAPEGASVNPATGLVTWVPAGTQEGTSQAFTLKVVNFVQINPGDAVPDDNADTQSWTVDVEVFGCPDGESRARPAVIGTSRAKLAVDGTSQGAPAVSGEARAGRSVEGRAIVRRAVGGFGRRCPKE